MGYRLPTWLERTARTWLRPRPRKLMICLLVEATFKPWRFFQRLRTRRTPLATVEFIETYLFPAPISLAFVAAILMKPTSPRVVVGLPLTVLYLLLLFLVPRASAAALRRLLPSPSPNLKQEQLYLWYLVFFPFIISSLLTIFFNPDQIKTFVARHLFVLPMSLSIAFLGQFLCYARSLQSFAAVVLVQLMYLPATAFLVNATDLIDFVQLGGIEALHNFLKELLIGAKPRAHSLPRG